MGISTRARWAIGGAAGATALAVTAVLLISSGGHPAATQAADTGNLDSPATPTQAPVPVTTTSTGSTPTTTTTTKSSTTPKATPGKTALPAPPPHPIPAPA